VKGKGFVDMYFVNFKTGNSSSTNGATAGANKNHIFEMKRAPTKEDLHPFFTTIYSEENVIDEEISDDGHWSLIESCVDEVYRGVSPNSSFTTKGNLEITRIFYANFDVLAINPTDTSILCAVISTLIESAVDLPVVNVEKSAFHQFVSACSKGYKQNPYHNFRHATCVTHFTYILLRSYLSSTFYREETDDSSKDTQIAIARAEAMAVAIAAADPDYQNSQTQTPPRAQISPLQIFTLLISAATHDIGHPGNNNQFEINSKSDLAVLYENKSVLENMHVATTLKMMESQDCNIIATMPPSAKRQFRFDLTTNILSTDMTNFPQRLQSIRDKAAAGGVTNCYADANFVCRALLQAADLSNPVRPFEIAKAWATLVTEEFNSQVDKERALGLPVTAWMDARDDTTMLKNEIQFGTHVCLPLYTALCEQFPLVFGTPLIQLRNNLESYKKYQASLVKDNEPSSTKVVQIAQTTDALRSQTLKEGENQKESEKGCETAEETVSITVNEE